MNLKDTLCELIYTYFPNLGEVAYSTYQQKTKSFFYIFQTCSLEQGVKKDLINNLLSIAIATSDYRFIEISPNFLSCCVIAKNNRQDIGIWTSYTNITQDYYKVCYRFTNYSPISWENFWLEVIENKFNRHKNNWLAKTRGISSSTTLFNHLDYLEIINMGADVIPLLLKEVKLKSGRWYNALTNITKENPSKDLVKSELIRQAWLNWGVKNNYLN